MLGVLRQATSPVSASIYSPGKQKQRFPSRVVVRITGDVTVLLHERQTPAEACLLPSAPLAAGLFSWPLSSPWFLGLSVAGATQPLLDHSSSSSLVRGLMF